MPVRFLLGAVAVTASATFSPTVVAQVTGDSTAVVATVRRFHEALAAGDSLAALNLLADDAQILESGGLERREDYRADHLLADVQFALAVPRRLISVSAVVEGRTAWVTTISESSGAFQGRSISAVGAELMVLTRDASGWRIRAIHWSSRPRPG